MGGEAVFVFSVVGEGLVAAWFAAADVRFAAYSVTFVERI